ncbi:hypothetical protein B0H13DRAFT_2350857 [Mycena leptocephala]|nr:hypothetical protein B0H13DRAFT_2350857 [Mycena leptocephala]
MPNFNDLPPEVTLEIFPNMLLKGLISAEGVCRRWKELISQANIHPVRLALLNLYQKTVSDPLFLPTRPWLSPNIFTSQMISDSGYWNGLRVLLLLAPGPAFPTFTPARERMTWRELLGTIFLVAFLLVHRITLDLTEISLPDTSSDGEGAMDEFWTIPKDCGSDFDGSEESQSSLDVEEYYRSREKFNYSPPGDSESGPIGIVFSALITGNGTMYAKPGSCLIPTLLFLSFCFTTGPILLATAASIPPGFLGWRRSSGEYIEKRDMGKVQLLTLRLTTRTVELCPWMNHFAPVRVTSNFGLQKTKPTIGQQHRSFLMVVMI